MIGRKRTLIRSLATLIMVSGTMSLVCPSAVIAAGSSQSPAEPPVKGVEDILRLPTLTVRTTPVVDAFSLGIFSNKVAAVSADQIEALGAHDLADALRRVPGVTISRFNMVGAYGGGEGGSFTIRGHGWGRPGSGVSTMVGGIPRFNGIWTHPLLDTVSIDMAHSIEVYKTPQPALFGNMAFGAVNIEPARYMGEGSETRLFSSYGSYETYVQKLEHGGAAGRFDYYLSLSHRESDGHRENADGRVDGLYLNLGYDLSPHWDLSFRVTHTESFANDPRAEGEPALPRTERYETDTEFYALTLAHDYDTFRGDIQVYYEDGWAKWEQWESGQPKDHYPLWDNYGFHLKETFNLWPGSTIVAGLDYDMVTANARDVNPSTGVSQNRLEEEFRKVAPYALVSQELTAGDYIITPSLGMRWTDSRHFDNEVGYQGGISIARGNTELYANAAHAVNYPGIYAAMFYENIWPFLGTPDAWQDLDPETMDQWEVGVSQALSDWGVLDISWYHASVEDAFRIQKPPPQWLNIGTYTSEGLEANLQVTPLDNLRCFLGANYMNTTDVDVPHAPEWSWSGGLTYKPTARLTLHMDAECTDDQYAANTRKTGQLKQGVSEVAGYCLVNAKVSYAIEPQNANWDGKVFVGARNITDEDYEYQPGYPMPGITAYGGVELAF